VIDKMDENIPYKHIFPLNLPENFDKRNKKRFSEAFVSENLKEIGWETYIPIDDTGIDLIAQKNNSIRFIQVKTREAGEEQNFGFTPRQRDIKTDPRFFFFLYSDHTNDFIIISIYDFLKIVNENSKEPYFSSPTFKQGNGKINAFRYKNGSWFYNKYNIDDYVNEKGILKMENKELDLKLNNYCEEIAKLKYQLLKEITYGKTFNEYKGTINRINTEKKIDRTKWIQKVLKSRQEEKKIIKRLDKKLKDSIKKYWYISPILMEWLNE